MAPADYKVKFKELKSRVGIDDVAYSLGYRLDRKAGVGRYIELVLGEGRDKRDTIIVSNRRGEPSPAATRLRRLSSDVTAQRVTWCRSYARTFHRSMSSGLPNGRR